MPDISGYATPMGALALALVIIYMLTKQRQQQSFKLTERTHSSGNGIVQALAEIHTALEEKAKEHIKVSAAVAGLEAKMDARHEEQLRTNDRFDRNFKAMFDRIDKLSDSK